MLSVWKCKLDFDINDNTIKNQLFFRRLVPALSVIPIQVDKQRLEIISFLLIIFNEVLK